MSGYSRLLEDEADEIDFRHTVIPETHNFAQFVTIDKLAEENNPVESIQYERAFLNSRYRGYRDVIWDKSKVFVTLSCIAVTIGCFAGFIQIFTETLVNWKTGHCARNWLLNKSFCCTNEILESNAKRATGFLEKREELHCIENGHWVEWTGFVSPFIIFVFLSLLFALASTLLVKHVAPMATGSGISEIKVWVSGFEYKPEFLSSLTLIVKSVALPLSISSGLSLGKEGPSVHYATCCGYIITKWLLKDSLTYSGQFEYLTAASGAGVAVAFGAPIGGVLFGLEEISSATDFNASTLWKSYYVALVAITTLKYINPFRNGKIILFNVTYDRDWKVLEVPIFILLGIFGGLYGKYVSKLNINYVHFRKKYLTSWPVQEVMIVTFITALLSYFNEFLKLDMTESMGILFHECSKNDNSSPFQHQLCFVDENTHMSTFMKSFLSLCFATFVRASLVIVSYGSKVPAGIFVPSMAVGATFGRAVSLIVERFISGAGVITPGAYAFLGAAATLCGITNLTLTVVVIMLELTGAFIYIIPTMIVVAITRIILTWSGVEGGISDQMIVVNGFPILEYTHKGEGEDFMENYTAKQIMTTDLITLNETMYVSELEKIIYESNDNMVNGFPIIHNNDKFEPEKKCVGYVLRRHLAKKLMMQDISSADANRTIVYFTRKVDAQQETALSFKDIVVTSPITVKPDIPTSMVFRMFRQLGCKTILIEEADVLLGLITSKDILRFERTMSRKKYGPQYTFNDSLNQKLWGILQPIINKFTKP